MLVISRRIGQRVYIGEEIIVAILDSKGDTIRIGIQAPPEVLILREELRKEEDDKDEPTRKNPS